MTDAPKKRGRPRKTPVEMSPDVPTPVENTPAVSAPDGSQLEALQAQVELLTRALAADRAPVVKAEETPTICLVRTGGGLLSISLTDAYGRRRPFRWESVGEKQYLTKAQWEELQESTGGKQFLDRGYLTLESDVALSLLDVQAWIDALDIDDIEATVAKIGDTVQLIRVFNYIDSIRVVTNDRDGKPLRDSEGNVRAEFAKVPTKTRLLQEVVATRLHELTGVKYSLLDD